MLKVVQEDSKNSVDATVAGASMLDEIVRDGARAMLAAALQAEVAAYIDAHVDELDEAGRAQRISRRAGGHDRGGRAAGAGAAGQRPAGR